MKKKISILLVMMMIFSMTSSFVFAEGLEAAAPGDEATVEETAVPEETPEVTDPVAEGTEEAVKEEAVDSKLEGKGVEVQYDRDMKVDAALEGNTNSVKVTWETEKTFTKSEVSVSKEGSTEEPTKIEVLDAKTDCTVPDLDAGKYTFEVKAKNGASVVDQGSKTLEVPAMPEDFGKFKDNDTLKTYSAYKSVVLEWKKPVVKPDYYEIWCFGDSKPLATVANPGSPFDDNSVYNYQCTNASDEKSHKYFVKAVNKAGDQTLSVSTEEKEDQMLMPMYVQCTFKQTKTLKAHDKSKAKRKFRKGETIKAFTFVKGQYRFYDDKGHLYYCNYNRLKNKKALYNGYGNWNYSDREAEYFINTSGQTSMTNYMLFVNLYTQHLYILSGKKNTKGRWKVTTLNYKGKAYRDWEVASGKATSPTPCGLGLKYGKKLVNIYKKSGTVYGHKTKNWNFYHSQTALHGRVGKNIYGKPRSLGCIRNTDAQAIFIKKCIPMKTRVAVY